MNIPTWLKPALYGAGAGAVVLAIVGFSWGGWVTGGSAAEMAQKRADAATVAALTPYCVENARSDPNSATLMADLQAATTYSRRALVEKNGWATPMGADKASTGLAQACQLALSAEF